CQPWSWRGGRDVRCRPGIALRLHPVGPQVASRSPRPVLGKFAPRARPADAPPDEAATCPVETRPTDGHPDARCADSFLADVEYGPGRPDLDDYWAQRAVRQRSDGCRRRSDYRI